MTGCVLRHMPRTPRRRWFLSQAEAATELEISPKTLRLMIRKGDVPTVPLGARKVIPRSAVEAIKAGKPAA